MNRQEIIHTPALARLCGNSVTLDAGRGPSPPQPPSPETGEGGARKESAPVPPLPLRERGLGGEGSTPTTPGDVTALLDAWNQGERDALNRLMELVEHELRHIAGCLFQGERREHTLQPTALVHELYLKLTQQRSVSWRGRLEFFAGAAHVMRRILVDHARKHRALKRGGDALRIPFEEALGLPGELAPEMIALDDALIDLERRSPRQCRVVELRVLVGLSIDEIAALLEVSPSTVSRDWKTARLFLLRELRSG